MNKIVKDNLITFFPVGNGDTTLISLQDGTNILIDCNITKDSQDKNVDERYDVKSYLMDKLSKINGITHIDIFILSHPDVDHCRQISKHFYFGNPDDYSDEDSEDEKIIIDEIWFSPIVFNEYKKDLSDDAKEFRKEAERRIELYKDDESEFNKNGNRVRIIGATDNDDLKELDSITSVAGTYINKFNGKEIDNFRFFVLGPIKRESDDEESERNECSIVLKGELNIDNEEVNNEFIIAGDSDHDNWIRILDKNDLEYLKFDIFLAPHHCSWYFFSNEEYDNNPSPDSRIIEFINNNSEDEDKRVIVASCKKILDDDDNPPHFRAAKLYKDAVGKDNFYCTSEYPDEDEPKPLIFSFTKYGPVKEEPGEISSNKNYITSTINSPKTYGK